MIKTNKDLFFTILVIIWFFAGIITVLINRTFLAYFSMVMCLILSVIVLFKIKNNKFALWLEKPLKKVR